MDVLFFQETEYYDYQSASCRPIYLLKPFGYSWSRANKGCWTESNDRSTLYCFLTRWLQHTRPLFLLKFLWLTSIFSFTRRSMNSDATELGVITCLDAIVFHWWLLMLVQTHVWLLFFASPFDRTPRLSYIHFAAHAYEILITSGHFRSNQTLADLSVCTVFLMGIGIIRPFKFIWGKEC
jgi:hypothetical protein